MMRQLKIQELDVAVGDIVVCVSESSEIYTTGREYEVQQADDGRLGVLTDCGFIATTSASLFAYLSDYLTSTDKHFSWDLLTNTRKGFRQGELAVIGCGVSTSSSRLNIINDNFPEYKVASRRSLKDNRIAV